MANFDTIKTAIDANINTNGTQDITGGKMNSILKQIVDATGEQLTELESKDIQILGEDGDELEKKTSFGIIAQGSSFLGNSNYITYYISVYKGMKFRLNTNNVGAFVGYASEMPLLNTAIVGGYYSFPTSTVVNAQVFTSEYDGYFCVSILKEKDITFFLAQDGELSQIKQKVESLSETTKDNKDTIEGNLIVPYWGQGLVVQSSAILANATYKYCYFPIKKGENFKMALESNYRESDVYIGFCENAPRDGEPIIGGYSSGTLQKVLLDVNDADYAAPKDGYFVISIRPREGVDLPILNFAKGNRIGYDVINSATFAASLTIGSPFSTISSSALELGKISVQGQKGKLMIQGVRNDRADNYVIVVVNKNGEVLDLIRERYNYVIENMAIDLDDYNGNAYYIYFRRTIGDADSAITWLKGGIYDSISTLQKVTSDKAIAIIHFDGTESGENAYQMRRNFLKQYGIKKCSFCFGYGIFNSDKTDWVSESVKNEYWQMISEGYDFAWYPNLRCDAYDESGWDAYIDELLINLAKLNIYNITTWACGNMSLNQGLANSLKKHGFKIARAGSSEASEVYPYTSVNLFMPNKVINDDFLVNSAIYVGGDSDVVMNLAKDKIDNAIRIKSAFSILTHLIEENPVGNTNLATSRAEELFAFLKGYVDEGKLEVMTWREYYAAVNIRDGYENDYNRLLKMTIS